MKDALVTLRDKLRTIRRAATNTQENRGPLIGIGYCQTCMSVSVTWER